MCVHLAPDAKCGARGNLREGRGVGPIGEFPNRNCLGTVHDQMPEVVQRTRRSGIDGYVRRFLKATPLEEPATAEIAWWRRGA